MGEGQLLWLHRFQIRERVTLRGRQAWLASLRRMASQEEVAEGCLAHHLAHRVAWRGRSLSGAVRAQAALCQAQPERGATSKDRQCGVQGGGGLLKVAGQQVLEA